MVISLCVHKKWNIISLFDGVKNIYIYYIAVRGLNLRRLSGRSNKSLCSRSRYKMISYTRSPGSYNFHNSPSDRSYYQRYSVPPVSSRASDFYEAIASPDPIAYPYRIIILIDDVLVRRLEHLKRVRNREREIIDFSWGERDRHRERIL